MAVASAPLKALAKLSRSSGLRNVPIATCFPCPSTVIEVIPISSCRATEKRGQDAHTDGRFDISDKGAMEIMKLFFTPNEDLQDKRITDFFDDEFSSWDNQGEFSANGTTTTVYQKGNLSATVSVGEKSDDPGTTSISYLVTEDSTN